MDLETLKTLMPLASNWTEVALLTRGNSKDVKLRVVDENGTKYMLRISREEEYEAKKKIYDLMCVIDKKNVAINRPLAFGRCADGRPYTLFSWIDGLDADDHIRYLSFRGQYAFGLEIGEISSKITSCEAPESERYDWYEDQWKKFCEVREWYSTCGFKVDCEETMFRCIEEGFPKIKNRPLTIVHADYQISNFMICPGGHASVIDFDFIRYADPMFETSQMVYYTRPRSTAVAAGQVDGYCRDHGTRVEDYFYFMRFYAAIAMMGGLKWWYDNGGGEPGARVYLELAQISSDDFEGFTRLIPQWYQDVHAQLN